MLLTICVHVGEAATDTFVPPTLPDGRQCFCPGDVDNYTCNATGEVVTRWTGTSFDCSGLGNILSLLHDQYSLGLATQTCNDGAIIANGISVDTSVTPNCYTSELSVSFGSSMDGKTVGCFRDTQQNLIGSHTLRVAGKCACVNIHY